MASIGQNGPFSLPPYQFLGHLHGHILWFLMFLPLFGCFRSIAARKVGLDQYKPWVNTPSSIRVCCTLLTPCIASPPTVWADCKSLPSAEFDSSSSRSAGILRVDICIFLNEFYMHFDIPMVLSPLKAKAGYTHGR
ncbi:hypothetical protein GDO86_020038 [Hymenochirus boettgeri]|uniref:Uncharacterized protein n=1 Tax=Hymenochirus boettgeri TaxID=247094 RepID=A0A8T2IG10_9PIPI|nr:hypothetical protein GDO86_020038 [Hymenochirus boettgeri]